MKLNLTGLSVVALLVIGTALPGYAEDAAAPATPAPAAEPETPPPAVPRPAIVPKTAEPTATPAAEEPPPPRRHYAHRYRRYGYYRTAYWQPFPIFFPHFYRNGIHWSRVPWASPF